MSAIYDWSVLALRNVYDRRIQGKPVLDSAALFLTPNVSPPNGGRSARRR